MKTGIAIIPARGGSKRLPRKNIRLLNGKPLIYYTLEAVKQSKLFSKIILSSDDDEILELGSKVDGITIEKRDKSLAEDNVKVIDLVKKIAKALGIKPHIFPVPVTLMKIASKLIRKDVIADRLFGDLRVDSSKAEKLLDWVPIFSMDEQLKEMAEFDNLGINK